MATKSKSQLGSISGYVIDWGKPEVAKPDPRRRKPGPGARGRPSTDPLRRCGDLLHESDDSGREPVKVLTAMSDGSFQFDGLPGAILGAFCAFAWEHIIGAQVTPVVTPTCRGHSIPRGIAGHIGRCKARPAKQGRRPIRSCGYAGHLCADGARASAPRQLPGRRTVTMEILDPPRPERSRLLRRCSMLAQTMRKSPRSRASMLTPAPKGRRSGSRQGNSVGRAATDFQGRDRHGQRHLRPPQRPVPAARFGVMLQRTTVPPTEELGLWAAIRNHAKAISFGGLSRRRAVPAVIKGSSTRFCAGTCPIPAWWITAMACPAPDVTDLIKQSKHVSAVRHERLRTAQTATEVFLLLELRRCHSAH